ncbi:non-ribosomal peptide synthetase [Hydrogenophaga sp. 2FB]|uniref:non-ribosomal peptide synthetase n=1 Tax=Hydrogenophaga sp. 2FB TaxID=2502187 RepID=UPI0010F792A2|nr:non-ribosomal peptide synthetase [Hydrogenophaga sp. 2FB]
MSDTDGLRMRLQPADISGMPTETLTSLFASRSQEHPERLAYAFVRDTLGLAESVTYAELFQQVCQVADALVRQTRLGDRVLLVYPPGLDFVRAFWACVITGRIAIPVPAPDAARFKNSAPRLLTILQDASASLLMISSELNEAADALQDMIGTGTQTILCTSLTALPPATGPATLPADCEKVTPETIAYLQYTSGSTSAPRGVILTHRNIVAQCHSGIQALDMNEDSRVLTWLPHHHDYGLVLGVLWPLGTGIPSYLLSSLTFLRRPLRWLEAIARFGVTHTGGPNFSYAACVRALQQQPDWQGDLSSLRSVSCGAEPIQLATLNAFAASFQAHGLAREALMPSYGMAETVLGITTSVMKQGYRARTLHVPSLENHQIVPVPEGAPDSRAIVACGVPFEGMELRIVDPQTRQALPAEAVGEVWVRGTSVGQGYWEQPESSQATFHAHLDTGEGPFLRTGDLGFLEGREVFITGRIKDLIIVRGRNLYPHDLEWTAQSTDGALRVGYGAAFSVEGDDGEDVVIVQEVERREKGKDLGQLTANIRKAIAQAYDLPLRAVVLVQAGSLPRTSSGKIRRRSCRQDYLDGQLQVLHLDEASIVGALDANDESLPAEVERLRSLSDSAAQRQAIEQLILNRVAHFTRRSMADLSLEASAIECGLDSLTSFRMLQSLEALLNCAIPSSLLLAAPDLRAIAARLQDLLAQGGAQPVVLMRDVTTNRQGLLPLSTRQQRMWFWQELAPGTALYNIPISLRMEGALDPVLLQNCLHELVQRHEILRLRWVNVEGTQRQRVEALDDWRMHHVHLAQGDEEAARQQLEALCAREAAHAFDLLREPAVRATLVTVTPQQHQLLWIFHHSVSDGWSIKVILEELSQLYTARSAGKDPLLPEPALQYLDFAEWETRWLDSGVRERELRYWKEQLRDAPISLELPTDHRRPVHQQFRGGRLDLHFARAEHEALRQAAKASNTTLFMVLLAAWQLLMHRYSGQSTVVTASAIANRSRAEFDRVVGYFANTLPLRSDFTDALTVADLLAQVKAASLGAFEHHHVPFEEVVDALDLPRDRSRMPLTQTFFVLQPSEPAEYGMGDVVARRLPLGSAVAKFDLSLELQESDEGLRGWLEYDRDLFEPATIERMAQHLRNLQAGICADATQSVGRVPMLTAAERHLQLVTWNDTAQVCTNDIPIQTLIEEQVRRAPDHEAVVFGDERVDYQELNRRANRVAHQLRRSGVGPDVRVGICMERSVELVVAYLAVAKAGGAFVPMDPDLPQERLAFMLRDTAAPVVITQPHLVERLPAPDGANACQWLVLAPHAELSAAHDGDDLNPACVNTPDDLAYVIYTSGSTGQPRGVMVPHRALSNHALWQVDKLSMGPHDRLLQKTTISFDASISDFYHPLLSGSTIVMAEPGMHRDTGYLVRTVRDQRITLLVLVPSQLQALLDDPDIASCRELRWVCSGGEALSLELADRFRAQLPHAVLGNFYGPSETTIDTTLFEVSGPLAGSDTVPIGRPVANAQCYVLDTHGELVPAGVIGELHIGGAGLARGYLNRPDLTAALFAPHPFEPGQRVYRTGDLVRWLPDGQLEYIGRRDFQVKLRGVRMELGEIEAALKAQPHVQQAVAMVREDAAGLQRLVAYVVGAQAEPAALKQALRQQLPEAMVPSAIVPLPQLPTLPNGKLDRSALPAPDVTSLSWGGPAYEAPDGDAEVRMAAIWSELLGVPRVGRHDAFFELGGHSLLVMRMLGLLRHAGYDLTVRAVFNTPTLSALAAIAQKTHPTSDARASVEPSIPPGCTSITPNMVPLSTLTQAELDTLGACIPGGVANIQDIYPLAPLQEGILFHHQLETEGDIYLTRVLLACDDADLQNRFVASIQAVVDRHEALRTAVLWDGLSAPTQVVLRHAPLNIVNVDVPPGADALETLRAATDANRVRLDLGRAPLMSVFVAQDPKQRRTLIALLSHHIISDHVSIAVMLEEGLDILEGRVPHGVSSQPYRDFVALSRHADAQAHTRYFERQLGDVSEPTTAFGMLRAPADQRDVGVAGLALDPTLAAHIRQSARTHGVSPAVLFHVAWAVVVARCASVDDVVFGTVLSGRLQGTTGMERTVGLFINTLPVRVPLAGQSVKDVVQDTYLRLIELVEHEHASLGLAQRCSAVAPTVPLFNNILNYRHGRADMHVSNSGARIPRLPAGMKMLGAEERTHYPMGVSVDDLVDGFALEAQAIGGIDAQKVAQYLAHAVEQLVRALEQEPNKPVLALDILSPAEQHALWLAGNPPAKAAPLDQPVHVLIERQAQRTPLSEAVALRGQTLDYASLNAQAHRLAQLLRTRGVGPDVPVVVCMERSLELVVGILAVMRAGGAFVPMDPDLPAERLAFMLSDTAAAVVLTQSHLLERLPAQDGAQRLCIDTLLPTLPEGGEQNPPAASGPDDLAYIIYTSGSTGQPKGVMVTHRALTNLMGWTRETVDMSPGDRMLQVITIGFDPAVVDLLLPLTTGATTVLAAPGEQRDTASLARTLRDERITHVSLVPSQLRVLLDEPPLAQCDHLRHVICGGEALEWPLVRQFAQRLPQATLGNFYGPTEATITAAHGVAIADGVPSATVPIGRPIANAQCHVLDARQRPVPMGVAGELYIGGTGLARGYLNRPDLTAERFLPHPVQAGQRLYRTGDLVRRLPDGRLEYLGRTDFQVKLRGIRIELGEVEAALREQPAVRQAVAIVREDSPGLKRLVAYLVGQDLDAATLKQALRQRLPDAMVPSAFVLLEHLPTLPNGKLHRAALPAPEQLVAPGTSVAPTDTTEQALWDIWAELLQHTQFGVHDNFFELGGHSLLAMQVLSRVRAQLGIDVPLRALFDAPTVAAFAQRIGQHHGTARTPQIPKAPPAAASVLTAAQQGMWFAEKLNEQAAQYNISQATRLRGPLDLAALERSLQAVCERHALLRSHVVAHDGVPMLAEGQDVRWPLARLELPAHEPRQRDTVLQREVAVFAHQAFDLAQAPLARAAVVRLDEQDHVVVLVVHHIACDGWSLNLLLKELASTYDAQRRLAPSNLAQPALQWRDVAHWEQTRTQSDAFAASMDYWRQQLQGLQPLRLPIDIEDPAAPRADAGLLESIALPTSLVHGVERLAQQHNASVFMVLLAAFKLLLMRRTGQQDVAVGMPVVGRDNPELESVVGPLLNTLVLRSELQGVADFRGLLHRVRDNMLDAWAHQEVPFDRLVAELSPQRELDRSPFFDVLVNAVGRWEDTLRLEGLTSESVPIGAAAPKFSLTLYIQALPGQVHMGVSYRTDRLCAPAVRQLLEQLAQVLQQAVQQPEQPLEAFSLLTPQSQALLADPASALPPPAFRPVTDRLFAQAAQRPDHIAVRFAQQQHTYADLERAMLTVATRLRDAGVGPGDVVAIAGNRSFAVVTAMLAALVSGAVFVTLDPAMPLQRRQAMLRESKARAICLVGDATQDAQAYEGLGIDVTLALTPQLDDLVDTNVGTPASFERPSIGADDPAYIFFTSGSTGVPKAVVGRHRGLSHFLDWQRTAFDVTPQDRVSQLVGLSFDPMLRDVLLPLTSGATLCIPQDRDLLDPMVWLARESISIVHSTPSVMQAWLRGTRLQQPLNAMRWWFAAGEPLLDTLVTAWRARCGTAGRLVNLYGPTETTMARCFHVVEDSRRAGIQPVGRALPDSQVLVLDATGRRCGIGEGGEVVLRTPLRSLGYLNLPEETRQRFRANPWRANASNADAPDDLLYFTGDRGRFRHDGVLEIAGRLDDQLKIRGVRVEPAEVAAALAAHPAVQQCTVMPGMDREGMPMLVAYVVAKPSKQPTVSDLRADLARQLPEAYLPGAIVFLAALPMQVNGKVDRARLPAPDAQQITTAEDHALVMPRSPIEQALWDIWRTVLRSDAFGVHENFFELGGHSLLATQVVARIRDVLAVELPLRALFEAPHIAGLAAVVEQHLHETPGDPVQTWPALTRVDRDRLLPTSYSQRRMWLVQQVNPETTAYNMPFAARLRGALDSAVLVASLHKLMERHEAFRTTLVAVDGEPMQRIGPVEQVAVEHVDLHHLPVDEREAAAAQLLNRLSIQPYDLASGPLHRPTLVKLDDQDHVLFWSIHHAIGDGWSAGILMREMAVIYPALLNGREPALTPPRIDFADYASWQREAFDTAALSDQLRFWKQALQGLEPLPLPFDRRRQGANTGLGARITATFEPATLSVLRRTAAEHNATPYMLLLACFQLMLGRFCGVKDVAVGTPIANRTQVHAEHLIGTLVNTVVMRTDLSGDLTFVDLLQRVRETSLQAYAHQDLPFEALVEAVHTHRNADTAPLVQVLFNVLAAPQPAQSIDGLSYEHFKFETGSAQFDLSLSVDTHATGLAVLSYSTDVFEPATGERLLSAFMAIVERVVSDPLQRLSSLPLLGNADQQHLADWNDTAVQPGAETTVHGLLDRQAARTPAAAALEQTGVGSLRYGELMSRANRLAHALRSKGIGRGALVGLCVDRGIDMVVAQLAVLKAGAAYVPLDPAYPADRLAYMAEDARLALLITEAALVHALHWPRDRSLLLDVDIAFIAAQPDSPLTTADDRDARPEDPAYVIYTSGSTGKPKGVVVHHRAVVNFLNSMAQAPGLTAEDSLVAVTTLSFDIAVLELLLPLSVGARVVLATRDQTLNGAALRQLIEHHNATVMQATPSTWRILIDAGWQGSPHFKALIGGEGLPQDLAEQLLARTGALWNMYGPTETTVWSTCWKVTQPEQGIFIGRPIANTTVHILDESQQPCPVGVPGEIYIGGDGVTLGYLHRPELTAERFIADPFQPGARLYRTGDRGRWRNNGLLEHQGRLDFQVKVRGHRIELGEIESQLGMHPQVARTVVIVREDVPGDVRLVAYVVPQADMPPTHGLREHLRASLPEYMVPQHFIELASIPLLPNGKINRHELPKPSEGAQTPAHDLVPPGTPSELAVAEVWQRLLGVSQVGVTDNFFDLGGHSLLAMRAITELNKRPGVALTVRQLIFDNLGQIAATMDNTTDAPTPPDEGDSAPDGWFSKLMDRIR